MSRILITGSSDGFGLVAAQQLIAKGHTVYLHARSSQRAADAEKACPGAAGTLIADLSSLSATKQFAYKANALGPLDVVIHNAGVFLGPTRRTAESDMPTQVFVNGETKNMDDMFWEQRGEQDWNDFKSYCDTKLQLHLFANGVAKKWKGVTSVATVHPGWVATKLGGKEAPDRLEDGVETYVKLAEGDYDQSLIAPYFEPRGKLGEQVAAAGDEELQAKAVRLLEEKTGLKNPS
ncbi:hypothetical protein BJY04DRAFT_230214 [Aspergillus karnatakaensis]|uniref:uncharacterized protein n=1 Tax=Aspergillus karnatakaensis TaxID=1810916 RepID=UPI003CCD29EA